MLVEQLTGTHIYRTLPRGIDIFQDIFAAFPMYRPQTIFDVGANVGQSAQIFLANLPKSNIYCFEPATETFRTLQLSFRGERYVTCYHLAFGSSIRTGEMVLQGSSEMFFLLGQSAEKPINMDVRTEYVDTTTIDHFCGAAKIDQIGYLKIDTEGGDLDVLNGAHTMLTEQRIDIVQVEAGMNPANKRHVSFESLKAFLESRMYVLFGIYEQVWEWPTGKPHLRRTNPIFISQRMVELNQNAAP